MGVGALVLLLLVVVMALTGVGLLITSNSRRSDGAGNNGNNDGVTFKGGSFTIITRGAGGTLIAAAIVLAYFLIQSGLLSATPGSANAGAPGTAPGEATATASVIIPPGPSDVKSQVLTAFNNFCQALHANQLDTAFGYLTPGYQQSVGSSANLPNAVGGMDLQIQETASDCSVFSPPNVKPNNQEAIELGNVVVTDSDFGTHTIARNFDLVLTNNQWLINNIYAQ